MPRNLCNARGILWPTHDPISEYLLLEALTPPLLLRRRLNQAALQTIPSCPHKMKSCSYTTHSTTCDANGDESVGLAECATQRLMSSENSVSQGPPAGVSLHIIFIEDSSTIRGGRSRHVASREASGRLEARRSEGGCSVRRLTQLRRGGQLPRRGQRR